MAEILMSVSDFKIPESLSFKAAFVIVTVLYASAMIILFRLYRKAVNKMPKAPNEESDSLKEKDSVRNKRRKNHRH